MSSGEANLSQDPELLAAFLDETQESLGTLDSLFIQLEANPADTQTVEAIFRPVHSLKGNSAFFGFMQAKRLAHVMESVLDAVRKGRRACTHDSIDLLLQGLDELRGMFGRIRASGTEVTAQADLDALVSRLEAHLSTGAAPGQGDVVRDLDLIAAALPSSAAEALSALGRLRARFAVVGERHDLGTPIEAIQALLGGFTAGTLDEERSRRVKAELQHVATAAATPAGVALATELLDGYDTFVSAMGFDILLKQYIQERLPRVTAPDFAFAPAPATSPAAPAELKAAARSAEVTKDEHAHAPQAQKSMRVAEATIDTFLHYVGELLVVGDMFGHLHTRTKAVKGAPGLARDLRRANETFAELSNQLQKSIMAIRRVAIKPALAKVPRLVRDIAQAKGKDIVVEVSGEHLEVDKSLMDLIDAPLTHMVRNAADHGVELPDDRERAGKSRQGRIKVSAIETETGMVLTIEDDGKGLDLEAIRRKAESLGLVAAGAALAEQDIVNFIFASGVSTAKEVTEISGRGVGMDVVKRAIDDAGGQVSVKTEAGKGSRFQLRLPKGVTTQIMPGYMIRAGGRAMVLPLDRVVETFRVRREELTSMVGGTRCIQRRGEIMPVLHLAGELGLGEGEWGARGLPLVIVTANRRHVALAVDAVLGVQKVVVRQVAGLPAGAEVFTGGALLGDGTVALVLGVDLLVAGDRSAAAR